MPEINEWWVILLSSSRKKDTLSYIEDGSNRFFRNFIGARQNIQADRRILNLAQ
jgi:hypothetical protein